MAYIGKQPAKVPLTSEDIVDDSIESADIKAGTIVNSDINAAAGIVTTKVTGAVTSITSHGLATSATTDTTNADNIGSGTLPGARLPATLPAKSGVNLTALNATELTSGTLPDSRLPATLPAKSGVNLTALNATEITSGTLPNARFPVTLPAASGANLTAINATQLTGDVPLGSLGNAPETDVTSIRQDIAMLALYSAMSDNRAAYNLPFSFIDQFQDNSGIATETQTDRVVETSSLEYVATIYTIPGTETEWDYTSTSVPVTHFGGSATSGSPISSSNLTSMYSDSPGTQNFLWGNPGGSPGGYSAYDTGFYADYGADYSWTKIGIGKANVHADITNLKVLHATAAAGTSSWTPMDWTGVTFGSNYGNSAGSPVPSGFLANGSFDWAVPSNSDKATAYYFEDFPAFTARYLRFEIGTWAAGANTNVGWSNLQPYYKPDVSVTNATGTLVSNVQTAPVATTKMSGVILYKDGGSGAATLGTHLKIYLTANLQGSSPNWTSTDWTEVVSGDFGAVTPLFSTGVKMVRLAEQTVVSGTATAMKAVWASQASTTMITQLHGWAMNY